MINLKALLHPVRRLAKEAGRAIQPFAANRLSSGLSIQLKPDLSPVTAADLAAHEVILQGLSRLSPALPIVSEEGVGALPCQPISSAPYWLVDPLDGTRGFIRGFNDFSVNIALIQDHAPVLGVIYSPIDDVCYYAAEKLGAFKQMQGATPLPLGTKKMDWAALRIILGRYHDKQKLRPLNRSFPDHKQILLNSSLKFCRIAEGRADAYLRRGPTGEWDTAAGQSILKEAGGVVCDLQCQPFRYNARNTLLNGPFIAAGDQSAAKRLATLLQESLA